MYYTTEEFHFVLEKFGQHTASRMSTHRRTEEMAEVRKRLEYRRASDELRAEGWQIEIVIPTDDSSAEIAVTNKNRMGRMNMSSTEAADVVRECLAIRDGFMSTVIPLRLSDVLLVELPKPFVLEVENA